METQVILYLLGTLQVIFVIVFKSIFEKLNKLDEKITSQISAVRKEMTDILDKHYVTTGQLSTMDEKFSGEIKGVTQLLTTILDIVKNTGGNK